MLKTFILISCILGCAIAERSFVLIWGSSNQQIPSLNTVSEAEFANMLKPLLETNTIVAFLEEDLSVRDLSCENVNTTEHCYAHLRNAEQKTFFASVENPLNVLRSLAKEHESNVVDSSGNILKNIDAIPGKVVFISFDVGFNGDRAAELKSHDAAMKVVEKQLPNDIVYIYLSKSTFDDKPIQLFRQRRDITTLQHGTIIRQNAELLLYFDSLEFVNNAGDQESVVITNYTVVNTKSNDRLDVQLISKSSKVLSFSVKFDRGYFEMVDIVYDNVKFYSKDISAPTDFSYHCGNLTLSTVSTLANERKALLHWNSLQFQAPFGSVTNTSFVFGDSWDCVYFFTPGILSGLLVALIFLMVLFSGVCWLMDINTMDRFDDPKGKTITIQTAE